MNSPEALYHLQEIERAIAHGRQRLKAIEVALNDDERVIAARDQVTAARHHLATLQTRARDLDLEIQSNTEKAAAAEAHLYSGKVRNPKEMQEMQQEIVALKKWGGELETQLLEIIYAVESAEADLGMAEAALAATERAALEANTDLLSERDQLQARLTALRDAHQKALAAVDPAALSLYNTLKPRKNQQPVAVLKGGTCGICGVSQTMAVERAVSLGQITQCINCERILVAQQ